MHNCLYETTLTNLTLLTLSSSTSEEIPVVVLHTFRHVICGFSYKFVFLVSLQGWYVLCEASALIHYVYVSRSYYFKPKLTTSRWL